MDDSIKNFTALASNPLRESALAILSSGLKSINTGKVMRESLKLENGILLIQGQSFDLAQYKKIKIVGFGKAASDAAMAIEEILGDKITNGAVIGLTKSASRRIETYAGSHPRPSNINLEGGQRICDIVKDSDKDDLIIAIVSGGGSALLCASLHECEQGIALYDASLKAGENISDMNTIRKHLGELKGGGLAKLAYPATVIGLIFSDIPGNHFGNVASGPTYKDETTIADAERIIKENNLGEFKLIETPKEDKYFEKVRNFVLVSNETAVAAMADQAKKLGFEPKIVGTELYDQADTIAQKIFREGGGKTAVLAAGEPKIIVPDGAGKGGRNMHMSLLANDHVKNNCIFAAIASDGLDNSDMAGAVIDQDTITKASKLGLDASIYITKFDSYNFFKQTGDLIETGPTGANVSDLMLLLCQ